MAFCGRGKTIQSFLHTPGHSPGSVVNEVESEGGIVLLGQDIHGPPDRRHFPNKEDPTHSLKFLLSFDINIAREGHLRIFEGEKNPIM